MKEIPEIKIGSRTVGLAHAPFVVAEMSGNHNQSLDRALAIVDAAAKAGAHALKIPTSTADTMTLTFNSGDFVINDPKSLWDGYSLYKLYDEAHTPWEWHKPIFDRCRELGIIGFSTPFDDTAVDFLESLGTPMYKIASLESTDLKLIERVAKTGKPMIISTGTATVGELDETMRTARRAGCDQLILLKCTSSYPASPIDSHIRSIAHMRELFQCQVGLSDHTLGVGVAVASVTFGACLIEKHFTLSRADGGVDSQFSLEPDEFKSLVVESERAWQGLGSIHYGPLKSEATSARFRRSLYVVKDIKSGETLSMENLRAIRPGFGLPTKFLELVVGKTVNRDVKAGTALSFDFIG